MLKQPVTVTVKKSESIKSQLHKPEPDLVRYNLLSLVHLFNPQEND